MLKQVLFSGYGIFIFGFIIQFGVTIILRHAFHVEVPTMLTICIACMYSIAAFVAIVFAN